jgi:hypothetical protein
MEIYNLLSCGIKYDIDDFESFLLKMILKVFLQNYFLLVASHCFVVRGSGHYMGKERVPDFAKKY